MNIDMINSVEISSHEAAWYLLHEPMSKNSKQHPNCMACWAEDPENSRELTQVDLEKELMDIWKEDSFNKYEKRPEGLEA